MSTFNQPFTSDAGFTYDSALAEFSAGKLQQVDQRPTNAVAFASFNTDKDLNWGEGTLTGTLGGNATVSGGVLDLSSGGTWNAETDNFSTVAQEACVIVRHKFGYTGNSPGVQYILQTSPNTANRIYIVHNTSLIQCYINDTAAGTLYSLTFTWTPTNATKYYELAVSYNADIGRARFLIGGVTMDTDTGTGTVGAPTLFQVGGSNNIGAVDSIIVFDKETITGNYTPNQTYPETIYEESKVDLPQFVSTIGIIAAFVDLETTDNGALHFIGDGKYYNGSAWVTSDGSYTQSNTVAEIIDAIDEFDYQSGTFDMSIIFGDGNDQMWIDDLTITYDTSPKIVRVYGYQYTQDGQPDQSAITVVLNTSGIQYPTRNVVNKEKKSITPDSTGYWYVDLIDTEDMEGTNYYTFAFRGVEVGKALLSSDDATRFNDLPDYAI